MLKGYVQTAEGQLHYRTAGTGEPPLLLLHQSPMSSEEFEAVLPLLSESRRCIAVDLMGHGASDEMAYEYSIEDYTRSIVEFMDALEINRACVIGHHTGASIAVELAASQPARVSRLVLSGCPVWGREKWQKYLELPTIRETTLDTEGDFLRYRWHIYQTMSQSSDPENWLKPLILGLRARYSAYDAHRAVAEYAVLERLPLIQCPTLLLSGDRDEFYQDLETTRDMIPDAKIGAIEGGGAFVPREDPDAFTGAILGFV
jgi:pimeloyl-ACP methyl ester carboxylesterase